MIDMPLEQTKSQTVRIATGRMNEDGHHGFTSKIIGFTNFVFVTVLKFMSGFRAGSPIWTRQYPQSQSCSNLFLGCTKNIMNINHLVVCKQMRT